MHRRQFLTLGTASLAALLAGCGSSIAGGPTTGSTIASATGGEVLVGKGVRLAAAATPTTAANLARFSAALYAKALPGTGNAVMSPYSIAVALGMTAYGAKGAAGDALAELLGGDPKAVAAQLTAVDEAVAAAIAVGKGDPRRGTTDVVVQAANHCSRSREWRCGRNSWTRWRPVTTRVCKPWTTSPTRRVRGRS